MMNLKLSDQIGKSKWFKWREALWLPRWKIYGIPNDEQIISNIERTALAMDKIRTMFGKEIMITSWLRPEKYNELIGGAKKSAHISGLGCDFMLKDMESKAVREILRRYLKDVGVRMENLETPHVHIDLKCTDEMPNDLRYFKP
jgi:hypothetical protein